MTSSTQPDVVGDNGVTLQKKVGLGSSVALVVGSIIGSGIFISPAGVAGFSGSVGLSLLLWGVGGLITMFGALSLVELGTMITTSGGEYTYIKLGLAGWVAYIWAWTQCILYRPAGHAIVILTCARYILVPVFDDGCGGPPENYVIMLSVILAVLIAVVNIASVRLATGVQMFCMVAKILALIVIIIGGFYNMAKGNIGNLQTGFKNTNDNPGEVMLALYSAMFAYDGWNTLNALTEEVIQPERTLPLAMYIGIPLIIVLYMFVNVSYFSVMSVTELVNSPAVAVTWADAVIPTASWVIPLSVALSTFGAVNGSTFSVGRLFYTAAQGGHQLRVLSYIHIRRLTPMPSIIFCTVFTIVYSCVGEVTALIDFLSFAVWMFYAITMVTLLVMRWREPWKSKHRPYRVPTAFPVIVLIFGVAMVFIPIATAPQMEFLYAVLVMLAGFLFYIPVALNKEKLTCMKYVDCFLQLLMEVVPPSDMSSDTLKDE